MAGILFFCFLSIFAVTSSFGDTGHVVSRILIKDIKIEGEFPFFEREICNAMTIYTGDVFAREELPKQKALIAEIFKREGFIATEVVITAKQDPKDGYYIIYVKIHKGACHRLEHLDIKGNISFSAARLKLKMKIWLVSLLPASAGRFIEKDLKEDIKNLTRYYRKKGYADCQIDFRIEKDTKAMGISVFLTIDEGPGYDIDFFGNKRFWDLTLKKDLIIFKEGNKKDIGLRRSARKIRERYRIAGYLETRVKIKEKITAKGNKRIRKLSFVIDEGPCSIVNSIQIRGNRAIDDEKLKGQVLTGLPGFLEKGVFVPETLEEDVNAIKLLYRKHGYPDAVVMEEVEWSEDKTNVAVNLMVEEGTQIVVSTARITGINVVAEQEAYQAILLKKGEPFREYMIQSDENSLCALISEKGYPYVRVKGEVTISDDRSRAEVTYTVNEGPYVKMGRVYYQGNFRTKEKIMQNEIGIKAGEPFSLSKMLEGQRNIQNMGIFNSVRFKTIGLKEEREEINLFVDIEEKKPYFVEMGGGYENHEGFFAHLRAGDRNLFGTNKDAWIAGEISQIGYRGELGIMEPRLFGSMISAGFGLFSERKAEFNKNFGTVIHGSSLAFTRQWLHRLTTGLSFSFELRDQFGRDTDLDYTDEFEPRSIIVTTPLISYDTRDSFIRPTKGTFSLLSVDISRGLENSLDDFTKYRLNLRYYFTPLTRLTFAWLCRIGYIDVDTFGTTDTLPDDQLFFLGGTTSVRGFDENMLCYDHNGDPVGGREAIAGSMEARIDLGSSFELTVFYDIGRVSNTFGKIDSEDFRSSTGIGLRYITPVGPIGFLYGIKLDRKEEESYGRLHFSLGYTF